MKKSAVIVLMVALFSSSAFAGSAACKFATKSVGITSDTNESTNSSTGAKPSKIRR